MSPAPSTNLTRTFREFFDSEKAGGMLLLAATAVSLLLANSAGGAAYTEIWHRHLGSLSVEQWINDALMAVFFLLIGLELERALYVGELADFRRALLPVIAAAGGVAVPALIHFAFNAGTPTQAGVGIPMATDIAFALGILALVGSSVPASLKIFLVAIAVMDDLAAILVIAVFYSGDVSLPYLLGALGVFAGLVALNRLRVFRLSPYLVGGAVMWLLMLRSGVHPTLSGVLLAFAIPFQGKQGYESSPSYRLEHLVHRPVAFVVLPLFALANTAVVLGSGALADVLSRNSLGIMSGLLIGKPIGITLLSLAAVSLGVCRLPGDLRLSHVFGVGILGGIGFTMSIFITNLAFAGDAALITSSKVAILLASVTAGAVGLVWLKWVGAAEAEAQA